MAEYHDREHFIPLRCSDLIDLLCADGARHRTRLTAAEHDAFAGSAGSRRAVSTSTTSGHFHRSRTRTPRSTPTPTPRPSPCCPTAERQKRLDTLFADSTGCSSRANFRRLSARGHQAPPRPPSATGASTWTSTSTSSSGSGPVLPRRHDRPAHPAPATRLYRPKRSKFRCSSEWCCSSSGSTSGSGRAPTRGTSSSSCSRTSPRWTSRCCCRAGYAGCRLCQRGKLGASLVGAGRRSSAGRSPTEVSRHRHRQPDVARRAARPGPRLRLQAVGRLPDRRGRPTVCN